ncbi:MAG: hypothetical protein WDZ94_01175 [Patescibacteria group bacterium]
MSATTRAVSAQPVAAKDKTMALLKKPETIVGMVVLGALGVLAINTFSNANNDQVSSTATESAQLADVSETENESESEEAMITDESATEESIDAISVLANTSGQSEVTAQRGDTFWKLAETHCGTGAAAEAMERANGYRYKQLQAGDIVEIICQ